MPDQRQPTSRDVAKLSGVSQPTVSYVLNNTPGQRISDATRARVHAAAASLGYSPSRAAQTLARGGRSRVVILNAPEGPAASSRDEYFSILSAVLDDAGWTLLTHFPPSENALAHLLKLVESTNADAVLDAFNDAETIEELVRRQILVVPLVPPSSWTEILVAPVEIQMDHLVNAERRNLATVSPTAADEAVPVQTRTDHLRQRCAALGLPEPVHLWWTGDLDALTDDLRAHASSVDGVLAHNDATALPVLSAAHRLGLRVPDDLAVVGADDSFLAALTVPALTSVAVKQSPESMKRSATRIAHALSRPDDVPESDLGVEFILVARESA
ncbi:LacI family DNA-binding transcriptional regulator [Microbacterium sp. NPDC058345]|uniref:LacI family DNA-binding transcriptional regulator n=1 Tax=Microbacterium sp. NPDC058345 TaxID=3346455 RepID=UPI00365A6AF2